MKAFVAVPGQNVSNVNFPKAVIDTCVSILGTKIAGLSVLSKDVQVKVGDREAMWFNAPNAVKAIRAAIRNNEAVVVCFRPATAVEKIRGGATSGGVSGPSHRSSGSGAGLDSSSTGFESAPTAGSSISMEMMMMVRKVVAEAMSSLTSAPAAVNEPASSHVHFADSSPPARTARGRSRGANGTPGQRRRSASNRGGGRGGGASGGGAGGKNVPDTAAAAKATTTPSASASNSGTGNHTNKPATLSDSMAIRAVDQSTKKVVQVAVRHVQNVLGPLPPTSAGAPFDNLALHLGKEHNLALADWDPSANGTNLLCLVNAALGSLCGSKDPALVQQWRKCIIVAMLLLSMQTLEFQRIFLGREVAVGEIAARAQLLLTNHAIEYSNTEVSIMATTSTTRARVFSETVSGTSSAPPVELIPGRNTPTVQETVPPGGDVLADWAVVLSGGGSHFLSTAKATHINHHVPSALSQCNMPVTIVPTATDLPARFCAIYRCLLANPDFILRNHNEIIEVDASQPQAAPSTEEEKRSSLSEAFQINVVTNLQHCIAVYEAALGHATATGDVAPSAELNSLLAEAAVAEAAVSNEVDPTLKGVRQTFAAALRAKADQLAATIAATTAAAKAKANQAAPSVEDLLAAAASKKAQATAAAADAAAETEPDLRKCYEELAAVCEKKAADLTAAAAAATAAAKAKQPGSSAAAAAEAARRQAAAAAAEQMARLEAAVATTAAALTVAEESMKAATSAHAEGVQVLQTVTGSLPAADSAAQKEEEEATAAAEAATAATKAASDASTAEAALPSSSSKTTKSQANNKAKSTAAAAATANALLASAQAKAAAAQADADRRHAECSSRVASLGQLTAALGRGQAAVGAASKAAMAAQAALSAFLASDLDTLGGLAVAAAASNSGGDGGNSLASASGASSVGTGGAPGPASAAH